MENTTTTTTTTPATPKDMAFCDGCEDFTADLVEENGLLLCPMCRS